jgi:hypothetical protein
MLQKVLLIIKKKNINSSTKFTRFFLISSCYIFFKKRFVRVFEQDAIQEDIFSAVAEPVVDK